MKLIVGLGNPGSAYRGTRHNAGFELLELLARRWRAGRTHEKFSGRLAEATAPTGEVCFLLWPETYMNRSGEAVGPAVAWLGLDPQKDLLVLCDDLNLPLGQIRLRAMGSDGGHRGLRDVIRVLGTERFARLRLGIGPKPPTVDATSFVLGRFGAAEGPILEQMLERAVEAIETWCQAGIEQAMCLYNVSRPQTASSNRAAPEAESKEETV
jgi:PTH1 family peptidyl-tRNA hydrolase